MGLIVGTGFLTATMPHTYLIAKAEEAPGKKLHYRPLNGRRLRELAAKKAHHGKDRFINPMGIPRDGRFRRLLSWKLFRENPFEVHLDDQPFRPISIDWDSIRIQKGLSVTFLKHAGMLIKDEGRYLLIDPVFGGIFWFIKDFTPIENLEGMPRPDHVLITHGHYDHLDKASLAMLDKSTPLITPLGYRSIFKGLGMKNHHTLDWFGVFRTRKQEITLLPCNHWTFRSPLRGPNRSLWGSYLIRTSNGQTIYISGDTAYFDGFSQLGSEYAIDLAIFNLGAYEPRWFMAPSHMNPDETVRAFKELGAKKLMIVHWGTFRLGDEPVHFPPMDIRKALEKEGMLDRWVELSHGKTHLMES
ncbi:MAG: MBL fold metallo-hydrolase [Deltaproteobacteria bacterium]|nr:MBL fold metallo-hydrolase [Deltaproteobacteria bacterium]